MTNPGATTRMEALSTLPDAPTPAPRTRVTVSRQETAAPAERVVFPNQGFLITGYGTAGYSVSFLDDTNPNDFVASMSPVLLFQIADRFLFEAEVEFELEEGVTRTGLEYAQVDYTLSNNLQLAAGKFLLPFNAFSERFHPSWINKFVSSPPLYGHGHEIGPGPAPPLLPLLSDVGAQLRGTFNVGRFGFVTGAAFVTQGPSVEAEEEHEEEEQEDAGEGHAELEIAEVVFGRNFEDQNESKMVGGRLGFGIAPYFEVNVSAMTGDYDETGTLRFTAFGAHLEGRYRQLDLHGEWIRTEQELAGHEETGPVEVLSRHGYFIQAGYRLSEWEPLVRWTQMFSGELDEEMAVTSGEQVAFGLAYWLRPNLALKAEYLINQEDADVDNDRLALEWAFGF